MMNKEKGAFPSPLEANPKSGTPSSSILDKGQYYSNFKVSTRS